MTLKTVIVYGRLFSIKLRIWNKIPKYTIVTDKSRTLNDFPELQADSLIVPCM